MKPTCDSCGARLRHVKSTSGRWLRLDVDPVENGVILLEQTLWGETTGREVPQGRGSHRLHQTSCPDADPGRNPVRRRRMREPS